MFFSKRQKGQSLVEFALILPALLMILLGVIEVAIVFQAYLAVQHAAREAARFAVTMEPPLGEMVISGTGATAECDGSPDYWGFTCRADELLDEWQERRVRIVQEVARLQSLGLTQDYEAYEWDIPADTNPDPWVLHPDGTNPRFFGVLVSGYYNVGDYDFEYWYPGLEGLPVTVKVYYSVKLLDPLYQAIIPGGQVRLAGEATMVNEGMTVGFAHLPLPEKPPSPTFVPTDTPVGEPTATLTPTDTPTPTEVPGPTSTPTQTPTPTSTPPVPYIVLSQYEDVHAGDTLTAWLYQHPVTPTTTFDLWWYTGVPTGTGQSMTTVIATSIGVNGNGLSGPIQFSIPNDTEGTYYLVSYASGTTTPEVARSALVTVDALPPDLVVQQIDVPERIDYAAGEPLTVTLEIANLTATGVYTYFDIDIYVDRDQEPYTQLPGYHKQWRSGIGPRGTISATIPIIDIIELWGGGQHTLWAQVDTSDRVPDELDETNNVNGPVTVNAGCSAVREDNFGDGSLDAQWTFDNIPSSLTGSVTESGGRLTISTNGTALWGGDNSFSYLYQMVEGDFDARVQVIEPMNYTRGYAKIGLMVRQDAERDSPYVMINRHSYRDRSQKIQWAARPVRDADPSDSAYLNGNTLPVWLRLVRQQGTFYVYFATSTANPPAEGDWTLADSYTVTESDDFDLESPLMVGIAAAAYHGSSVHQGVVDNFWLCLVGEGGDPPFPRYGNRVCTQPIQTGADQPLGGGSFELGWEEYWSNAKDDVVRLSSPTDHTPDGSFSLQFKAETFAWQIGCGNAVPRHPWLAQSISIPDVAAEMVEMPDGSMEPMLVTLETSFWRQIEPRATPSPDPFLLTVRDVSGGTPITLTNTGTFTEPGSVLIVRGDDPATDWNEFSDELVRHIDAAGYNVRDYAGQELELYWYAPNPYDPCDPANDDPSPDAPDLANTYFYLDDVFVETCAIVPTPDIDPSLATISGTLQVSRFGSLEDAPGTLVWAYSVDGPLYATYTIHDSTYHFYNIPPGTAYTIYSEAWRDEDLFFTLDTIPVLPAGVTEHNLVLK